MAPEAVGATCADQILVLAHRLQVAFWDIVPSTVVDIPPLDRREQTQVRARP